MLPCYLMPILLLPLFSARSGTPRLRSDPSIGRTFFHSLLHRSGGQTSIWNRRPFGPAGRDAASFNRHPDQPARTPAIMGEGPPPTDEVIRPSQDRGLRLANR